MDGDAREWFADYFKQQGAVPTWKTLINAFSKYFSTQGRGEKNLHDAWRKLTFTPDTDDIEVFIRDIQELAKQLEYSDQVLITTLRAAMPREIYGTLYQMEELSDMIDFCKNYYAKSPAERLKAQEAGKLETNPFKKIQKNDPPNITDTLTKLTESLNKLDFTQKPYKPTLYPSGRGRGRGRGRRTQGRKFQGNSQTPYQPHQGRGRGASEENPEEENLIGVLQKESLEKTPRQRMLIKIDADIAAELAIG